MLNGKFSVVIPAYNEAHFIEQNIIETVETFESFGYDFEIVVVDDGSPDQTHLSAAKARLKHPERVRVVRYEENQGKGSALACGVKYAIGEYIVFLDADMDLHPSQLPVFFEIMELNAADAVIGSKWHPLSRVVYPPIRRLYSIGYYMLVRLLFGLPLRDTQTGLKLFRKSLLDDILPRMCEGKFAFDIELLAIAHRRGFRIFDAPVTLDFRRAIGRLKGSVVWRMLLDTLTIFYRLRISKYYDRTFDVRHEPIAVRSARELLLDDGGALATRDMANYR